MRIGIPREIKEGERRVCLLPPEVAALVEQGHEVRVEHDAASGVGVSDEDYRRVNAKPCTTPEAWNSELVVKVKELLAGDLARAHRGQAIFGFQQLPGFPARTRALAERGLTAIGFELVRDAQGGYPLLAPMSVISGRMAVEAVWKFLPPAPRVVVLGAGNAGLSAARTARDRGAQVVLLTRTEVSRGAARQAGFETGIATSEAIETAATQADLVVGAVLRPGEPTPKLLPRSRVARMKRGAVIADICIDGGGVAETSRPTTHAEPTYVEEGVVHYAIANIPGADPHAASAAISKAALPFVARLATRGIADALRADPGLRAAVLVWKGRLTHPVIAAETHLTYTPLSEEDLA
jgi:alanine dehydrogenase